MALSRHAALGSFLCLLTLGGCQIAGQVQSGRQALLADRHDEALGHFQAAAASDPNYAFRSGPFHEGIYAYIGQTYYRLGKFSEARQALERALGLDRDDYLARIYLGLTLARSGDRARGLVEVQSGLKGLFDWLEYLTYRTGFGIYWDPNREIRVQIDKDLAAIAGKNLDWEKLIADAEWVGKKTEDEVEIARRDEQRQLRERFPGRPGVSLGIGF